MKEVIIIEDLEYLSSGSIFGRPLGPICFDFKDFGIEENSHLLVPYLGLKHYADFARYIVERRRGYNEPDDMGFRFQTREIDDENVPIIKELAGRVQEMCVVSEDDGPDSLNQKMREAAKGKNVDEVERRQSELQDMLALHIVKYVLEEIGDLSAPQRHYYEKIFKRIRLGGPSEPQAAFIPIIGGGQILAEDGTLKTKLAKYIRDRFREESSLRVDTLSPDSYLLSYSVGLREAKPDCYDWGKITSDIMKLKRKETISIQDPTGCKLTERQIGPLDIILFEGIYSCLTPELKEMADFIIGVVEERTNEDYLEREKAKQRAPYNNGKGYTINEILNIFAQTQFSVRKDYFSREIQKANLVFNREKEPELPKT